MILNKGHAGPNGNLVEPQTKGFESPQHRKRAFLRHCSAFDLCWPALTIWYIGKNRWYITRYRRFLGISPEIIRIDISPWNIVSIDISPWNTLRYTICRHTYQRAFQSHFLSNHKVRDCLDCFQKQLLVFLKQKFVWKTFSTCVFKYFLTITFISDAFFSTNFFF